MFAPRVTLAPNAPSVVLYIAIRQGVPITSILEGVRVILVPQISPRATCRPHSTLAWFRSMAREPWGRGAGGIGVKTCEESETIL
jgi:hypothetical protein